MVPMLTVRNLGLPDLMRSWGMPTTFGVRDCPDLAASNGLYRFSDSTGSLFASQIQGGLLLSTRRMPGRGALCFVRSYTQDFMSRTGGSIERRGMFKGSTQAVIVEDAGETYLKLRKIGDERCNVRKILGLIGPLELLDSKESAKTLTGMRVVAEEFTTPGWR